MRNPFPLTLKYYLAYNPLGVLSFTHRIETSRLKRKRGPSSGESIYLVRGEGNRLDRDCARIYK